MSADALSLPGARAAGFAAAGPAAPTQVLLLTDSADTVQRLQHGVATVVQLHTAPLDPHLALQRLNATACAAVLIDFTGASRPAAARLAGVLRHAGPLPLAAVGRASDAADAMAALRASVHEFVDLEAGPQELRQVLAGLMRHPESAPQAPVVALLGARGGLGISTLAANLALLLQQGGRRVLLLDLGLPVADSRAILGVSPSFHFAEAARSIDRLDRTLVESAIARTPAGIAVLPLPAQLQELRDIPQGAAAAVLGRLRSFFDAVLLDLGGFSHAELAAQLAAQSDHAHLVCDQASTSVLSTARLASELQAQGVTCGLVANRVHPSVAPSALELAAHLRLPLAASLPERQAAHLRALNEGRLLAEVAPRDPYVRALHPLARSLVPARVAGATAGGAAGWRARLSTVRMPWQVAR